jgi:uncharacterized membrane protein
MMFFLHAPKSHQRESTMRIFGISILVSILIGCSQKPISYRDQVQPILNNRCVSCHGADKPAAKIVLTSYADLMNSRATKFKKPIVVAGNLSESWLYLRSGTDQPHFRMPPDTSRITPLPKNEIELIGKWIQQGAKDN